MLAMSEINPDFSFPAIQPRIPAPQKDSGSQPASLPTLERPLSFSSGPRPKRHAHRRSAAMSEDLGPVELATLLTPQMPNSAPFSSSGFSNSAFPPLSPFSQNFSKPASPSSFSVRSSSSGASFPSVPVGNFTFDMDSPRRGSPISSSCVGSSSLRSSSSRDSHDSRIRIPFIHSPSPRRTLVGEPGQLVPQRPTSSPLTVLTDNSGSAGTIVSEKKEKRKKRRSFIQMLRKSCDFDTKPSSSPPDSPGVEGDETLVPSSNTVGTMVAHGSGVSSLAVSPIVTPRNSGETNRSGEFYHHSNDIYHNVDEFYNSSNDSMPTKPSIDLDEALSCSFDHRSSETMHGTLVDPLFNKPPSIMGAVPEEEEGEGELSEVVSLNSLPHRQPASILQKTNSTTSSTGSILRQAPISPRVSHHDAKRTISYVGPVSSPSVSPQPGSSRTTPPMPNSPSRSLRFSYDQVSNLAISEPAAVSLHSQSILRSPDVSAADLTLSSPSQKQSFPKKSHARKRSLIDKILRRT